jgi:F-type H+-transporting ATP synthase subunit e
MLRGHLQVLRWSALAAGVFYGVYHQAAIKAQLKVRHIDNEYEKQQSLIQKAKAEWAKKTLPKEKTDSSAGELIFELSVDFGWDSEWVV